MSKLILTKFNKVVNLGNYLEYEKSCMPEQNQPLFIYKKYAENTVNNPDDNANQNIIKKAFGFQKLDKINKMTST